MNSGNLKASDTGIIKSPFSLTAPYNNKDKLRIIQAINVRWLNATAWYGLWLAKLLCEAGHDCRVIAVPGTDTWRKAEDWGFTPLDMDLNNSNPIRLAASYARLRRLIGEYKPHIVNCHRGEGFFLWATLRKQLNSFALIRTRGDQRRPRDDFLNKWLHNHAADALVATNTVMANYFTRHMGTPPRQMHTILGGVDQGFFHFDPVGRAALRREFNFADNDTVIGLLGRFDTVKDQPSVISACAALRQEGRPVRLLLIGDATSNVSRTEIQKRLEETNLSEFSVITGKRADVPACISAMDIGIVASLGSETIARAALEIMACRRPLISTNVGVMPDLLPEEALIPPGQPAAMAKKIAQVMDEPNFSRSLLADAARRLPDLSGPAFVHKTLEVYQLALAKAGIKIGA